MSSIKSLMIAIAIAIVPFGVLNAAEYKLGDLVISDSRARATPPRAKVAAGFLTITNNGSVTDRLLGGSADFAGKVEVHSMKMENDVMKMRPFADGLEIKPGETVVLKPGGLHIMFMKLDGALKAGDTRAATLRFERAGEIEIVFPIRATGHDHDHGHKKHDHGDDASHDGHGKHGHKNHNDS
ncbi:MAG: copper chaperone PCu(A)C [Pseudomonadota bacterium]